MIRPIVLYMQLKHGHQQKDEHSHSPCSKEKSFFLSNVWTEERHRTTEKYERRTHVRLG